MNVLGIKPHIFVDLLQKFFQDTLSLLFILINNNSDENQ